MNFTEVVMKEYIIINHLIGSKAGQVEGFLVSTYSEITIGRDSSSILKFDKNKDIMISSRHAKITISNNPRQFSLLDLNSRNGTFINKRRAVGVTKLKLGDIIQAGLDGPAFEFDLNPRPNLPDIPSTGQLKRIVLQHLSGSRINQSDFISLNDFRELVIGRGTTSMIKYDQYQEYMISREQIKITPDLKHSGQFIITDLDSKNGTFLNSAKLLGSAPIKSGDTVTFGGDGPSFLFKIG